MSELVTTASSRRWWALGLIATAQFMVIMDTSIIGVALPKMQTDPRRRPGVPSGLAAAGAFGNLPAQRTCGARGDR